ncbi:Homeodomain-like protein [Radiomyces spectabilis]|uniref:Homeodomain-like protein n=1 Tax=Radiomyces spectabilis TaxID=64574 RepID=UPI00221F319C|nr:Homeodomain-like protein [Radiomyces spectabilis]KAI8388341.1 Homeodomain-like protein [Radiomyces spectabilis]
MAHEPTQPLLSPRRPSVLDISNLLCPTDEPPIKSPSLSPSSFSSSFSPCSVQSNQSSSNNYFSYTPSRSYPPPVRWMKEDDYASSTLTHSAPYPHIRRSFEDDRRCDRVSLPSPSYSYMPSTPQDEYNDNTSVKPKRRRASAKQLEVLNRVFERTFFPSTQMRIELGKQLGMSPRTVQIWFQNRRQALRTRQRTQNEGNQS